MLSMSGRIGPARLVTKFATRRTAQTTRFLRTAAPAFDESNNNVSEEAPKTMKSDSASPTERKFNVRNLTYTWVDKLAQKHLVKRPAAGTGERKLVLKKMQDSYTEVFLPFKSDPHLLEEYVSVYGEIRLGKLMEDLDALAGNISYKHADDGRDGSSALTIVTASVDRLDMFLPEVLADYKLSGHVSYVGYSSMEVFIKVETIIDYDPLAPTTPVMPHDISEITPNTVLQARFTMVAKDAWTGKAAQVNPLLLEDEAHKKLFQMGEDLKARKRRSSEMALSRAPPTEDERMLIHDLYLEYSQYDASNGHSPLPPTMTWMRNETLHSVHLMQPQERNIHNFIFGGYLMRSAYELAFCNASTFLHARPVLLALDEITFRKPVPIGSQLHLASQVVYAEGDPHHSFQISVTADVVDPVARLRETTNVFQFTFKGGEGAVVRRVVPETYAESMRWIEGKRRRLAGAKARAAIEMRLKGSS